MMITVSELEAIIAQTLADEQVQCEGKPIGSVDQMTRKLTELKLKRSGDPDYLIFVGIDRFGECFFKRRDRRLSSSSRNRLTAPRAMHPPARRDLARLRQLDHVHRRRPVAASRSVK
jgi:hypothetical protein